MTNIKNINANHETQRERNSGHVFNLSGCASASVHLLIDCVKTIFSVSAVMSVFNEPFKMYQLPLISKTWDENRQGIICVVFSVS